MGFEFLRYLSTIIVILAQDDLPEHVMAKYNKARTMKKKNNVVADILSKNSATGKWEVDLSKPKFEEDHKRHETNDHSILHTGRARLLLEAEKGDDSKFACLLISL